MYRSEYIVCFRSEISFVPLLFSHRTPFLRPYWQIYFNSTSNHNTLQIYHNAYGVVSYFHFTSNHNIRLFRHRFIRLFLISILHQTTTLSYHPIRQDSCFLFPFYIKPQLADFFLRFREGCFLFPFYIKPQRWPERPYGWRVVSYFHSTSNHNTTSQTVKMEGVVSYFHSTSNHNLGYAIC